MPFGFDDRALLVLRRYSRGQVSAYNAATEIQELGLPGLGDVSAADVVVWARQVGFGTPRVSREEAEAEAEAILRKRRS
jgi:hypothetical protein